MNWGLVILGTPFGVEEVLGDGPGADPGLAKPVFLAALADSAAPANAAFLRPSELLFWSISLLMARAVFSCKSRKGSISFLICFRCRYWLLMSVLLT